MDGDKGKFVDNMLELQYLGIRRYDLLGPKEAAKLYRLVTIQESEESRFEDCLCDMYSCVESNYHDKAKDLQVEVKNLLKEYKIEL